MSVTTTSNAHITAARHYLADYDLHHSQPSASEASPAPAPNSHPAPSATNPPNWETQYRRVPAYRPAVNQVDEQRNTYTSEVERNFVRVMFGGVWFVAATSQLWRATGGRINSGIFRYKIGGEW